MSPRDGVTPPRSPRTCMTSPWSGQAGMTPPKDSPRGLTARKHDEWLDNILLSNAHLQRPNPEQLQTNWMRWHRVEAPNKGFPRGGLAAQTMEACAITEQLLRARKGAMKDYPGGVSGSHGESKGSRKLKNKEAADSQKLRNGVFKDGSDGAGEGRRSWIDSQFHLEHALATTATPEGQAEKSPGVKSPAGTLVAKACTPRSGKSAALAGMRSMRLRGEGSPGSKASPRSPVAAVSEATASSADTKHCAIVGDLFIPEEGDADAPERRDSAPSPIQRKPRASPEPKSPKPEPHACSLPVAAPRCPMSMSPSAKKKIIARPVTSLGTMAASSGDPASP